VTTITQIFSDVDDTLFDAIMKNSSHVLRAYPPERRDQYCNLTDKKKCPT